MAFIKKTHTPESDASSTYANDLESRIESGFTTSKTEQEAYTNSKVLKLEKDFVADYGETDKGFWVKMNSGLCKQVIYHKQTLGANSTLAVEVPLFFPILKGYGFGSISSASANVDNLNIKRVLVRTNDLNSRIMNDRTSPQDVEVQFLVEGKYK